MIRLVIDASAAVEYLLRTPLGQQLDDLIEEAFLPLRGRRQHEERRTRAPRDKTQDAGLINRLGAPFPRMTESHLR